MDLKAKLQEAKALISDVSRWTQGRNAVDDTGYSVDPTHTSACKWCSRGALMKVFGVSEDWHATPMEVRSAYTVVRTTLDQCAGNKHSDRSMIGVNDAVGHAAVMEMFDCGINKLGG